ncbi:pectate lyase [Peribacillus deserti]|uniref:Pectate lyase n=1 Tax=Peribacillus deserti TaxID=673318 RepID=A0A2N5M862_9BACI|nr:pectate lyase [Peribacillus deserti]
MIYLSKTHDPGKNKDLIKDYTGIDNIQQAIEETNQLFNQYKKEAPAIIPPFRGLQKLMGLFLIKSAGIQDREWSHTPAVSEGTVYPEWKLLLDQEYQKLQNMIKREVDVTEFGAKGDGMTDCTEAFRKALGSGHVKVIVPEGIFVTRGIKLPSWSIITGKGKGKSVIKLHPQSSRSAWVITNKSHFKGNRNIAVEHLSLDWNVERLPQAIRTSAGNNRSSCLLFANVTYGWVKHTEGINPGLHCFDVSSTVYTYFGDGTRARGGSRYIWLDHLNGYGFGDDGITTHHSDDILISNSHMCDPSGRAHKKGSSNSNGIEVDDGSRNVWLLNNSTARCFGGVEIKAHHNASAAANVHIIGHLSINDNRSYNFRHIGHHKAGDPESLTAYNIKATNLVSIAPRYTDLYSESKPRGMVISGYRNVVVNGFTLIGDPEYDYHGEPVISVQYRARNIVLNSIEMSAFKTAGKYIKVFGGKQRADSVYIKNIKTDIGETPILAGKEIEDITIKNVQSRALEI